VSRAPLKSMNRLRRAPVAIGLAGLVTALAVAGCSAGQNTQTDSVEPAVNGSQGQVGPIAIRNAQIAYPHDGTYSAGASAPLILTIVNTGSKADELVEVTSEVAGNVTITGDRALRPGRATDVGTPGAVGGAPSSSASTTTVTTTTTVTSTTGVSAPPSAPPSSRPSGPPSASSSTRPTAEPVEIGKATIVLSGLSTTLSPGMSYSVTFSFRDAGSITLELPIATPLSARPEVSGTGSHG